MKSNLQAITPNNGVFTRMTDSAYTHIVVWVKDRGYIVSWHKTEAAAQAATRRTMWDNEAKLVGVFPVTSAPGHYDHIEA
jgi:hypothetical protein